MFRVEGHRRGSQYPTGRYLIKEKQARRLAEELAAEGTWLWLVVVKRLDNGRERTVWSLRP